MFFPRLMNPRQYSGKAMRAAAGGLLVLAVCTTPARAADVLLEPEQAFRLSARLLSETLLEVTYRIAPGYYLYRDKLAFHLEPPSLHAGEPQFPAGLWHEDEFFGRSEIYRDRLTVRIPVSGATEHRRFRLIAVSQGCADAGVCFLPIEQSAELRAGGLPGLETSPP
jgi:thioredoxin:protein disulfide reductase